MLSSSSSYSLSLPGEEASLGPASDGKRRGGRGGVASDLGILGGGRGGCDLREQEDDGGHGGTRGPRQTVSGQRPGRSETPCCCTVRVR